MDFIKDSLKKENLNGALPRFQTGDIYSTAAFSHQHE